MKMHAYPVGDVELSRGLVFSFCGLAVCPRVPALPAPDFRDWNAKRPGMSCRTCAKLAARPAPLPVSRTGPTSLARRFRGSL